MLYIFIYLSVFLLVFTDLVNLDVRIKRYLFFISTIFFVILSSIRWETGADWDSYFFLFRDIESYWKGELSNVNQIEFGYTWLNYVVSLISSEYTTMLFVNALFAIGLKMGFISRQNSIMFIALFFYYCYYLADITSVRQFVASSFTLLAIFYTSRKKVVPFIFAVFIAISIHYSAFVFLVAYYVFWRKTTSKFMYIFLFLSFVIGFVDLAGVAIDIVLNLIPGGSFVKTKLENYSDSGLETSSGNRYVFFLLGAAKRMIIIPFFIWRMKFIDSKDIVQYRGYLNLVLFATMLYFIFILSVPVMQRLSVYFSFFEVFLWGYFIMSFKDFNTRFLVFIAASLFGAIRLYLLIRQYYDEFVPFKTIFDF